MFLFCADALDADIGRPSVTAGTASAFTLAQIVDTEEQVNAALAAAQTAGGKLLKPGQRAAFGGFHGYFADPAGVTWEVAANPGWSVSDDGTVTIRPIE